MKNNDATTRIKKYEELRKDITSMEETSLENSKKSKQYTSTITIPINNNDSIETENIEKIDDLKKSKNVRFKEAEVYSAYKRKKIITMAIYIAIALAILTLVVWLIVFMVNHL